MECNLAEWSEIEGFCLPLSTSPGPGQDSLNAPDALLGFPASFQRATNDVAAMREVIFPLVDLAFGIFPTPTR